MRLDFGTGVNFTMLQDTPPPGPVYGTVHGEQGNIFVITLNNASVNALSADVVAGLDRCLNEYEAEPKYQVAMVVGHGKMFCGGADIEQFRTLNAETAPPLVQGLHALLNRVENFKKPIVAAINGDAFGGGLEFVMACHGRIVASTAKLGQPEVQLGVIPGGGGTQRLPRLVGVPKALDMCAGGKPITAVEALNIGLVDAMIGLDIFFGQSLELVEDYIEKPIVRTSERNDKIGTINQARPICVMARQMAAQKAPGLEAPLAAIEAIEYGVEHGFEAGCKHEIELFCECVVSDQSKALVHLFFALRAAEKVKDVPSGVRPDEIVQALVIGAGTMGGGITIVLVNAGIPVILKEIKQEYLDRGMQNIKAVFSGMVKKKRITQEQMEARLALITPTLTYDNLGDVDLVIEAAVEKLELKQKIFAELDTLTKPECALATNTSSLSIDAIAGATKRPGKVIGMHFFSPANVMKLLEVVRGSQTDPRTVLTAMKLAKRLSKNPVLVGNCFGFLANRTLFRYIRAALTLLENGLSIPRVDTALEKFGFPMGVFKMLDLAGVDVAYHVMHEQGDVHPIIQAMFTAGRYGLKAGKGFYVYEAKAEPDKDADMAAILRQHCAETPVEIGDDAIVERLLCGVVNEAALALREGIAQRASDVDVVWVLGFGFPPHKGGPLFWADQIGIPKLVERLGQFGIEPAPLIATLAEGDLTFAECDRANANPVPVPV